MWSHILTVRKRHCWFNQVCLDLIVERGVHKYPKLELERGDEINRPNNGSAAKPMDSSSADVFSETILTTSLTSMYKPRRPDSRSTKERRV